ITGYTLEEAVGNTPRLLKSGHHDDAFYRDLWERISSGNHFRATVLNKKRDGTLFWVEQTITPLIDNENQITHYVSVIKDITELRQKQEQDFQLDIARKVQQQFYPENVSLPGYDIAGGVYPADETGGDYYDFIHTPDGRLWFIIGDVAGHGIGSALIMSETRAYVHAYVEIESDPGTVLKSINRKFARDPKGRFVTMLLAQLDTGNRSLVFTNAGHLPAYLLDPAGEVSTILKNTAIPLGTLPDWQYTASEPVQLPAGHLLLFLTDGVLEAENMEGEQFGMDRVLQVIRANLNVGAQQIIERIYQAIDAFAGGRRQQDDITLVVCKIQKGL
ncbi:MAG: SpoIIE family protein phosphatase, partial [Anaerolineales bacterium]|nr:SpoIIE family protein phosphatase [Anaerolineales bacterium]